MGFTDLPIIRVRGWTRDVGMSGWQVMAGPLNVALRVVLVVGVFAMGRLTAQLALGNRRAMPVVDNAPVRDVDVVAAYNDALLAGWSAGEQATFFLVASTVGTSVDHVCAVIARHWQR